MAVLIILLCVFNLVMWLLAIVRFRKIFSTDDIIEKARHELNNMMMEINRNAERNISLIEDRIQKLKEVTEETDRHIEILRGELKSVENTKVFQSRLLGGVEPKPAAPVAKKTRTSAKKVAAKVEESNELFDEKNLVALQEKTPSEPKPRGPLAMYQREQSISKKPAERDSFSQEIDEIVKKSSFQVENQESRAKKNSSGPEIVVAENLIKPKKSKKDQVRDLAATGMTVDEIAQQLKTTTTEVEFILEML